MNGKHDLVRFLFSFSSGGNTKKSLSSREGPLLKPQEFQTSHLVRKKEVAHESRKESLLYLAENRKGVWWKYFEKPAA